MAILYFTGFETGDGNELETLGSGATIQGSVLNSGAYGYQNGASSSPVVLGLNKSELRVQVYLRLSSVSPASRVTLVSIQNSTGTSRAILYLTTSGKFSTQAFGGTEQSGSTSLSVDTWYKIDLRYKLGTGSNAISEIRLDGTVEATSSDGTTTDNGDIVNLHGTTAITYYADDIVITDDTANYPDVIKIIARQAKVGTATYEAWTVSSNSLNAASACSDTPFDGGSFILGDTNNTSRTMLLQSFSESVEDSFFNAGGVVNVQGGTGTSSETGQAASQGYTPRDSFSLKYIDVKMGKAGSPSDNITIEIRTTSPTGTLVATSDNLAGSSVIGSTTLSSINRFTFTTPVSLTGGTKYYLVFERTGSRDATNYYVLNHTTLGSLYPGGGEQIRANNSWGSESSTNDLFLRISSSDGTNLIGASDTIVANKVGVVAKRSNGSSTVMRIIYRYNSIDEQSPDISGSLSTVDSYQEFDFTADTGTPTLALLNASEIGGKRETGGRDFVIEDCWLMVAYTPAATAVEFPTELFKHNIYKTRKPRLRQVRGKIGA